MKLFESIMKAALSNDSDRKKFFDVTTKCVFQSIVSRYEAIIIESCIDVKFTNKADKPIFKIYLKNQSDVHKIHVDIVENNRILKISVNSTEKIEGFIDICSSCGNSIEIQTYNGDIEIESLSAKIASAIAKNGDIVVSVCECLQMDFDTFNGDITVNLLTNDYMIEAKTSCGDIIFNKTKSKKNSKRKLRCKSKNGDIVIGLFPFVDTKK